MLYCRTANLWVKVNEGTQGLTGPCVAGLSKRPEKCVHSMFMFCACRARCCTEQARYILRVKSTAKTYYL